MATQLPAPITVQTPYGPVQATHEAYGFIDQGEWNGVIYTTRVLGFLEGGKFRPLPADENETIEGADLVTLLAANATGKKEGIFRKDDVIALHKKLRAAREKP